MLYVEENGSLDRPLRQLLSFGAVNQMRLQAEIAAFRCLTYSVHN